MNINCRRFENDLPEWIAGRLPTCVAEQMQAHSTACELCGRMADGEKSLRMAWRELPPLVEAPDLWPRLAARISEPRDAGRSRAPWLAWLPEWGPSLRYGLAGVGVALALATVVMSRSPLTPAHLTDNGAGSNRPGRSVDESHVIQFVADRQALPFADGDLAIDVDRTPRYRQAERYVLGQSVGQ